MPNESNTVNGNVATDRRIPFAPVAWRTHQLDDDLFVAANFALAFLGSAAKLTSEMFWDDDDKELSSGSIAEAAVFISNMAARCQDAIRAVSHELTAVRESGPYAIGDFTEENAHWVAYRVGIKAESSLICRGPIVRPGETVEHVAERILMNWETCKKAAAASNLPTLREVEAQIKWEATQVQAKREYNRGRSGAIVRTLSETAPNLAAILGDRKAPIHRMRAERRMKIAAERRKRLDELSDAWHEVYPDVYHDCPELGRRPTREEQVGIWAGRLKRWGKAVWATGARGRNAIRYWQAPRGVDPDQRRRLEFALHVAVLAVNPEKSAADVEEVLRAACTKESADLLSTLYGDELFRIHQHILKAIQRTGRKPTGDSALQKESAPKEPAPGREARPPVRVNFSEWGIGYDGDSGWHVFQFRNGHWQYARRKLKITPGVLPHMLNMLLENKGILNKKDVQRYYAGRGPKRLDPMISRLRKVICSGISASSKDDNVLPKVRGEACWQIQIRIGHAEKVDAQHVGANPELSFDPCN